jgi:hypothetical protein
MIRLLKRLLPREPLPRYVHFHVNSHGNQVFCDESACQPTRQQEHLPFPFLR